MTDLNTYSNLIIAIATVINVVISYFLWKATYNTAKVSQHIFKASHRPYVFAHMKVLFHDNPETKFFTINADFKNSGSVPAKNVVSKWQVLIDGLVQQGEKIPDKPGLIESQGYITLVAGVGGVWFTQIQEGRSILEIETDVAYEGIGNEKFFSKTKFRYVPNLKNFYSLGTESN